MLGYYDNAICVDYGKNVRGLSFKIRGLGTYKSNTYIEIKNPVSTAIKIANDQDPSISRQGKKIGAKLIYQKNFWSDESKTSKLVNLDANAPLPKSPDNVLGLVDSYDVPLLEKPIMEETILNGSKNDPNLVFINNNRNI